jgi:transcription elongation factor GreB
MSKAFTKEDVDPPEKSGRARSASGLPPGATNYVTPGGAKRLRQEFDRLRRAGSAEAERVAELERILTSVTVVNPPEDDSERSVSFGARVTVRDSENREKTFRILGVDELDHETDATSWISPVGRILLAAKLGERITLPGTGVGKVVKVEYPTEME